MSPQKNPETDHAYVKRASWIQIAGLVAKLASPLLMLLTARIFPQNEFGQFISFQLLVLTISRLTTFGMDRSIIQRIASGSLPVEACVVQSSWLAGLLSSLIIAVGLVWSVESSKFLMLLGLLPWSLLQVWTSALEGLRRPEFKLLLVHLLALLLTPVLGLFVGLSWGFLLSNWIALGVCGYFLVRLLPPLQWIPIQFPQKSWLLYTLPVALLELVAPLIQRIDLWILHYYLGPTPVAVYSILTTLANGLRTVRQGFDNLVLTIASTLTQQQPKIFMESYQRILNSQVWIQNAIAVVLLAFPEHILRLAGKDYVKNIEALSIIVAGHLVFGVLGLSGQVLIGLGKSRLPLVVAVIALGISFIANLILVRILGVTGAAMSSSLVLALQGIALFFIAKRYTGFWLFHRKMLPSVSVALLIVLYSIYNLWGPIQRILG